MKDNWHRQLDELRIPYPAKVEVRAEIESHVEQFPEEKNEVFSRNSLDELYRIHNNRLKLYLDYLDSDIRKNIESTLIVTPLICIFIFLAKEQFMIDFFREGGAGMIVILLVGAILLFRELGLFFRTVLIKDHSKKNLRLDSMSVIVGVLALVLLGLGVTSLGAYVSVTGVMEHGLPINILLIGLKESITAFIVSATFSSLILHMHFTTRRLLNLWRAPIG